MQHARLRDAGIDAKLFDPDVSGVASYGRSTGASRRNAQVFVPATEAARARKILDISAELPADAADAPFAEATTMAIGKRVVRIVAAFILFGFVALVVMQIAGFFR